MEDLSTKLVISWRNINPASFRATSAISGWAVVEAVLTKPILTKRLFTQDELSRSRNLSDSSEPFSINALTSAKITIVLTTPFERKATKTFCTFSSSESGSNGLPVFNKVSFFIAAAAAAAAADDDDDDDDDDGDLTIRWYFSRITLTALSVSL